MRFPTHIFNRYLSNEKNIFADNSRVEPTIFFHGKNYRFLRNFFRAIFMGQSFIKAVRGPFYNQKFTYSIGNLFCGTTFDPFDIPYFFVEC